MPVQIAVTARQLGEMPKDSFFYELDEGELIRMPPAGEEHGWTEGELYVLIFNHVKTHGLGRVYPSDTGFLLQSDPDVVRAPDIAFVRKERLPLACDPSGYIIGAPDLAVEIQSPSQSPADLDKKVRQYLAAGAQAAWAIHPRKRQAVMYRRSGEFEILTAGQYLEAPDLLPGLRIPLAQIFKPE